MVLGKRYTKVVKTFKLICNLPILYFNLVIRYLVLDE